MTGYGVMSGTVPSQDVLCCNARSWARVIGWVQTVVNVIALLGCSIYFTLAIVAVISEGAEGVGSRHVHTHTGQQMGISTESEDADYDVGSGFALPLLLAIAIIVIGTCILCLAGGIMLVQGVNEENPSKLNYWIIMELIYLGFTMLLLLLKLVARLYLALVVDLIVIPIATFCLWVVHLHRQELLSAGRTASGI